MAGEWPPDARPVEGFGSPVLREQVRRATAPPDVVPWPHPEAVSMEQVEEVGELRIAFEPEASRLAASYATESTLAGIGEALDTMKASVSDPDAFIAADLRFHRAIVQASHNPLLLRIDSLLSAVYASVRVVHTWSVSRNEQTLPGHVRVLEAIRARDGDIAAAEMRSLVETALCDVRTICSFGEPTQEMV